MTEARYYRVVSTLPVLPLTTAHTTPEEAWNAWARKAERAGYDVGTARAAATPRLAAGTTRRAVEEGADVSEGSGRIGNGRWWLTTCNAEEADADNM